MPDVFISEQAAEDLAGIWSCIAADNPVAASPLVRKINDHCQSYAHQPELGEQRTSLGNDTRCFSVGMHVPYYRKPPTESKWSESCTVQETSTAISDVKTFLHSSASPAISLGVLSGENVITCC